MPDLDSDSNGDVTNIGETTGGKTLKDECQFENEIAENLGDKIDYNDNISKVSTLATSNEAQAFKVVTMNPRSKSNRRLIAKRSKSRKSSNFIKSVKEAPGGRVDDVPTEGEEAETN